MHVPSSDLISQPVLRGQRTNSDRLPKRGQVGSLPLALCFVRVVVFALLLALVMVSVLGDYPVHAQAPEGSYDEEEAQAIDQMLMCPVCPAESIDQAQVPLAKQMRQRVRELLAEGATREEVLDYFADRYGQNVLASPPKSGVNLLAWALPIVGLLAALVAVFFVLRAMKGGGDGQLGETLAGAAEDAELAPYLAAVDRSLALDEPDGGNNAEEQNPP